MDINKMTKKQFEQLPYIDEMNGIDVDSIVLLPSKRHHDSGFNVYEVVICNKWTALGKCFGYDTFSIFMQGDYNRVGIDCLRGSGLMRIFLPPDEYYAEPMFHDIRRKPNETTNKLINNILADKLIPPTTKDMWDKWKETLIDENKGER